MWLLDEILARPSRDGKVSLAGLAPGISTVPTPKIRFRCFRVIYIEKNAKAITTRLTFRLTSASRRWRECGTLCAPGSSRWSYNYLGGGTETSARWSNQVSPAAAGGSGCLISHSAFRSNGCVRHWPSPRVPGLAEGAQQYTDVACIFSITLCIAHGLPSRHPAGSATCRCHTLPSGNPEANRLILLTGPNMAGRSTYTARWP